MERVHSRLLFLQVSNPIREYLQIDVTSYTSRFISSFKPYKGVSSNESQEEFVFGWVCFKPYKGVSSNLASFAIAFVSFRFQTL